MDWFLYDRELRHERVNQLHALEQARGAIRALQSSMIVLLTKIVSDVNLDLNYSRKKDNLSCLTGSRACLCRWIPFLKFKWRYIKKEDE